MNECIIRTKTFRDKAKDNGIDESTLELITYKYWNETGKDSEYPSDDYISKQLGIGKQYKETLNSVVEVWNKKYSRPITLKSEYDKNNAFNEAKRIFPIEAITTYKTDKGTYILRVAEPVQQSVVQKGSEREAIRSKARRSKDGKLLANNGKESNLSEEQWVQVRTKDFKDKYGDWENPTIFTANNVDNPAKLQEKYPSALPNKYYHHSTNKFGKQPFDSREGKKERLHIIGRLTTDKVDVLVVENPNSSNSISHITLATADGVRPVESNSELQKYQDKIVPLNDYVDTTFKNNLDRNVSVALDENGEPLLQQNRNKADSTLNDFIQTRGGWDYIPTVAEIDTARESMEKEFNIKLDDSLIESLLDKASKDTPHYHLYAKLIKLLKSKGIPITVGIVGASAKSRRAAASTSRDDIAGHKAAIKLNPYKINYKYVAYSNGYSSVNMYDLIMEEIIHEVVHYFTVSTLDASEDAKLKKSLTKEQVKFANDIRTLYERCRKYVNLSHYGMQSEYEFISEALANPVFQAALADVKIGNISILSKFKRLLVNLFTDFFKQVGIDIKGSELEKVLSTAEDFLDYISEDGVDSQGYKSEKEDHSNEYVEYEELNDVYVENHSRGSNKEVSPKRISDYDRAQAKLQRFINSIDRSKGFGKALQSFIDEYGVSNVNRVISKTVLADRHSASWNDYARTLTLGFSTMATSEERAAVLLHELVHSRTTGLAALYELHKGLRTRRYKGKLFITLSSLDSSALTPDIIKAFDAIVECKEAVLKYLEDNPEIKKELLTMNVSDNLNKNPLYALLTESGSKYQVREFISEIYSNPAFIRLLDTIKVSTKEKTSLWSKIKSALLRLFNGKQEVRTVLDKAIENAEIIMRARNNVEASFNTISKDVTELSHSERRSELANYYAKVATKSADEYSQIRALVKAKLEEQTVIPDSSNGEDFSEAKKRAKKIAYSIAEELNIPKEMIAAVVGDWREYSSTAVPLIILKSYNSYKNTVINNANRYVRTLTNEEVFSEVLRLSADQEMEDSTFTFEDGTTIDTPFKLNDQQEVALQEIDNFAKNPNESVITLSGYAGTGKTSLMEMVANRLRNSYNVQFCATTHQAAAVLNARVAKSGFSTSTVEALFGIRVETDLSGDVYDVSKTSKSLGDSHLLPGSLVIIDEASMLSDANYYDVANIASMNNSKIIFLGDKAQLAPVGQDHISKVFSGSNKGKVLELTKVERTGDNAILTEATAIRNGKDFSYVSSFNDEGRGVAYIEPSETEQINTIISKFAVGLKTDPNFFRVLAFTNPAIEKYNTAVRNILGYKGLPPQVGEPMLGYNNWGYDPEGKKRGEPYRFVNSRPYRVIDVAEPHKDTMTLSSGKTLVFDVLPITLQDPSGNTVTIPYLDIKYNVSNKIAATEAAKEKEVLWNKWRTALTRDQKRLYQAKINEIERVLCVNADILGDKGNKLQKKLIDFGYAHTIHKSQGGTYTHVIMDADGIDNNRHASEETKQQLRYVGISRATDTVTVLSSKTKVSGNPISHMTETVQKTNDGNIAPTRPVVESTPTINIYYGSGEHAELSNFAERPFTHTWKNGATTQFKSVEQAFQYAKAIMARDMETADNILKTTDGAELRKLGKSIKNLDVEAWDNNKALFMKAFIKESFMQNPEALKKLLNTGNATLTHNQDKSDWGQMFPKILMQVREELEGYTPPAHKSNSLVQKVIDTFGDYFSPGSELDITKDYPNVSKELLGKLHMYLNTPDGEFTEEDAKKFLEEASSIENKDSEKENSTTITYTPVGKTRQTYTIQGDKIINKDGKEVFKEDSKDRRKIFANLGVHDGTAVVVEHKGNSYVVHNDGRILSVRTGDIMKWDESNGDRKSIIEASKKKFAELEGKKSNPVEETIEEKREFNDLKKEDNPENFEGSKKSQEVISSDKTILSNEELKYWNEQGVGEKPRILVASEHTDPAFHVKKIIAILNGEEKVWEKSVVNGKYIPVRTVSGKDFAGLYIVTKHDGLPMLDLLQTKIPKLIHFSITGLGGTKYEPGVMKYNDLLDRIEDYIKQGLDPDCITVRIDPIVPGVTKFEDIENIVKRASSMGIKRIRFSIMDAYTNTRIAMSKLGYDFTKYYGNDPEAFSAKPEVINEIADFMLSLKDRYGVTLGSCAENIDRAGISKEGCLSVGAVNNLLGTSIVDRGIYNNKQRKFCTCYGGKIDALGYKSNCASHCIYCYARHENDATMQYYNEDGTLKDNAFTKTRREPKSSPTPLQDNKGSLNIQVGTTGMLPPVTPSAERVGEKISSPNPDGPLKGMTLHSGGAKGADFTWGKVGAEYGVEGKHYYDSSESNPAKKPPYANTEITSEERTEGERKAFYAGKTMGRLSGKAQKVSDPLLIRDWMQVKNSDMVVAIAKEFNMPGDKFTTNSNDDRVALTQQVSGGTGWAVQMAINEGKPVYVYSQKDKAWFMNFMGLWKRCEAPVLSENFAGIGTREINADGEAAIRECYEKTINAGNNTTETQETEGTSTSSDINTLSEKMKSQLDKLTKRSRSVENVLSSSVMTSTEAKEIVNSLINLISDYITDVMNDPAINDTSLKDQDQEAYLANLLVNKNFEGIIKPFNPRGMSRLEVINKIGLNNLINIYVKSKLKPNADTTPRQKRKMKVLSENLDAILYLGSNALAINEGAHVASTELMSNEVNTLEEGIAINPDINDASDTESIQENEGSLQEKWQLDSRTIDVVESMSQLVRNELFKMYQVDSDGNIKTDAIGINKRIPVQETTKQLLRWLQGSLTLGDVVAKLKVKQDKNPWVKQLIEKLEDTSGEYTDFQNSFFSVFNKHFQPYSVSTVTYDSEGNQHVKRVPLNNKPFLSDTIKSLRLDIQAGTHPLFSEEGVIKESLAKLQTIVDNLTSLKNNRIARVGINNITDREKQSLYSLINQAASLLGYPTDVSSLSDNLSGKDIVNMIVSLGNMYDNILANTNNPKYDPLSYSKDGSSIRGSLTKFLEPITRNLSDITVDTVYDNGKMYQSYVIPSYTTKLFQKFHETDEERFKTFISEEYGRYDWFKDRNEESINAGWRSGWLELLAKDPEARNVLKHEVKLNYNKHNYMKRMTPNEYLLSMLSSFFSEGAGKGQQTSIAWYRVPILSNKASEEYIRFYAYMGADYKSVITSKLLQLFNQELSRIQTVIMQNYTKGDPRYIKNFHENGKRFCFLDFMNDYLEGGSKANSRLGELLRRKLTSEEWDASNEPELQSLVEEAVKNGIQERVNTQLEAYEKKGIVETAKVIDGIQEGFGREDIKENIERFLWNDTYAASQILELTITDIAFYADMEDLQKRLAQIHSPGVRGNAEAVDYDGKRVSDGYERTIYLSDFNKVKSNIISNVKAVFDRKLQELKDKPVESFVSFKIKTDEDIIKAEEVKNRSINAHEELYKSILKQYEDINVTDAQGYSSPTSYRKKMFIFGKWSREAEAVYQKLLNGEYSYHDLKVAFQPLKPFVYTQIGKPTGLENGPLRELKMPVQNKNSEYLLILADAILQNESTGQPNLLRAIFEIMEESAEASPTKGIDTVQFGSTVKSGLMGELDLNRVLSGGKWNEQIEVIDPSTGNKTTRTRGEVAAKDYILHNLYTKNSEGVVTGYNSNCVHEIPFEDYSLQQDISEHFRDQSLLYGSQARMIIPSDLVVIDSYGQPVTYEVEGRKLTAEEFRREYEETFAENIKASINEVCKELHLGSLNRVERNIVLSRMLQRQILESPRYSLDLYRACSLDPKTGEFRIPLEDPIQSTMIEQLLNSIIKKRVNEQRVAGGPVVQVSNFGTSRKLNIRFKDKNGGTLMTREEFNKSWKPASTSGLDAKALAKKLMKEEKLSYITALKEAQRRLSDSNNSPEGDVDKAYEEYIKTNQGGIEYFEVFAPIFSEEIFERFANADGIIDIQAMEEVCPEVLQMIGYRIPTEAKYSIAPLKIVGFLPREAGEGIMLPYDITLLTGSDFDIDKENLMRKEINIKLKSFNEQYKILEPLFLEEKRKESNLDREFTSEELIQLKRELTDMIDMFRSNNLRRSYIREAGTSPIEKKMWDIFKRKCYYTVKPSKGRACNNNKLVDMSWEVLTHETSAEQLLEPGGFEDIKRQAYLLEAMSNNPELSLEELKSMSTKELKKLGYNSRNLLYSDSQVSFYEANQAGSSILGIFAVQKSAHAILENNGYLVNIEELCEPFTLLGKSFKGLMEFDKTYDDDGVLIGKTLGSCVAASADTAKDPCLGLLNINTTTINVFATLLRLGVPSAKACLFMSQPIIKELLEEYDKENLTGYTSFVSILDSYMAKYRKDGGMDSSMLESEELTEKELIDNKRNRHSEVDYKTVVAYAKLYSIAKAIKGPTFITRYNSVNTAVGPMIIDNITTKYKSQYSDKGLYTKDLAPLTKEMILHDHPILDSFESAYNVADEIFKDFPVASPAFSIMLNNLSPIIKDKVLHNRELLADIANFFLSGLVINNHVLNENRVGYYIKEFPEKWVKDNIRGQYAHNEFVQAIRVNMDSETGEYSLEPPVVGKNRELTDRLSASWYELYKENPDLAIDLFNYAFFRGGIGFNPTTFMSFLPIEMRESIPNYKESFNTNHLTESMIDNIFEQYLAHNTSSYYLFPIIDKEIHYTIDAGGHLLIPQKDLLAYDNYESFRFKDSNKKWRYLHLIETREDGLVYKEVFPLGDNHSYLELHADNTPKVSIKDIYKISKKQVDPNSPQTYVSQREGTPQEGSTAEGVTITPTQEKINAERIMQSMIGKYPGISNDVEAKNALLNIKNGRIDINNPAVSKYLKSSLESAGLKFDINEIQKALENLC